MIITNLLNTDRVLNELGADSALISDVNTNPLYFQKLIVENHGIVTGVSLARVTTEMTWIPNKYSMKHTRQRALRMLLAEQTIAAKQLGINQTHVWTNIDPSVMKHFGFEERMERSYILHF